MQRWIETIADEGTKLRYFLRYFHCTFAYQSVFNFSFLHSSNSMVWVTLLVVIGSNVLYHLLQRSIAPGAHPLVATVATYTTAIVLCFCALPFFPLQGSIPDEINRLNWATYALGAACLAVEIGYLLAYRAGLNVAFGSTIANVGVAILLIPVGVLLFREEISWTKVLGITLCLVGVVLITKK
jgi:drug/metabolite transporter (DMT)-like permease